jgi:hypothetical protein
MAKLDGGKKAKADSLMTEAERKRRSAAEQEMLGKAQIKNKVKSGRTLGDYTGKIKDAGKIVPVGKERLDIAANQRRSAMVDEYQAKKLTGATRAKSPAPMSKPRVSKQKKKK